jgi:hypothetical protein
MKQPAAKESTLSLTAVIRLIALTVPTALGIAVVMKARGTSFTFALVLAEALLLGLTLSAVAWRHVADRRGRELRSSSDHETQVDR